jgi:hypothetical protein
MISTNSSVPEIILKPGLFWGLHMCTKSSKIICFSIHEVYIDVFMQFELSFIYKILASRFRISAKRMNGDIAEMAMTLLVVLYTELFICSLVK